VVPGARDAFRCRHRYDGRADVGALPAALDEATASRAGVTHGTIRLVSMLS
jgi:hypothetical protein